MQFVSVLLLIWSSLFVAYGIGSNDLALAQDAGQFTLLAIVSLVYIKFSKWGSR